MILPFASAASEAGFLQVECLADRRLHSLESGPQEVLLVTLGKSFKECSPISDCDYLCGFLSLRPNLIVTLS